MRATFIAIIGLSVGLAVFIAQGRHDRPLVGWNSFGIAIAQAASGEEMSVRLLPRITKAVLRNSKPKPRPSINKLMRFKCR